jgi:hypothetical protein
MLKETYTNTIDYNLLRLVFLFTILILSTFGCSTKDNQMVEVNSPMNSNSNKIPINRTVANSNTERIASNTSPMNKAVEPTSTVAQTSTKSEVNQSTSPPKEAIDTVISFWNQIACVDKKLECKNLKMSEYQPSEISEADKENGITEAWHIKVSYIVRSGKDYDWADSETMTFFRVVKKNGVWK